MLLDVLVAADMLRVVSAYSILTGQCRLKGKTGVEPAVSVVFHLLFRLQLCVYSVVLRA